MTQGKKANQIFVSYRRDDTAATTGRLYDHLTQKFGREAVFKDLDSLPLGVNFKRHIESVIKECAVMLVVIGDRWLGALNDAHKTRLENPSDFVRVEVEAALRQGIPIIPLFVQNGSMPSQESLPDTLRELVYLNGMTIGFDPHFHADVTRLISGLEAALTAYTTLAPAKLESFFPECETAGGSPIADTPKNLIPTEKVGSVAQAAKVHAVPQTGNAKARKARWYIYIAALIASEIVYVAVGVSMLLLATLFDVDTPDPEPNPETFQLALCVAHLICAPFLNGLLALIWGYVWPMSRWKWGLYLSFAPVTTVITLAILIAVDHYRNNYELTLQGTLAYVIFALSILFIPLISCTAAYWGAKASLRKTSNKRTNLS